VNKPESRTLTLWLICGLMGALAGVFVLWYELQQNAPGATSAAATRVEEKRAAQHSLATSDKSSPIAKTHSIKAGDVVAIPPKWRFRGIASTQSTALDLASFNLYTEEEQAIVRRFNLLHPFVWGVHSAAETAWMAANGFPLPEEVIAADHMSDAELKDAADDGGMKAKFLYYDRLLSEVDMQLDEFKQQGGTAADFAANHLDLESELHRMYQMVSGSDSPFLGYLEASRAVWIDDPQVRNEVFAGGLALAYFRGDDRAGNALSAGGYLNDAEAGIAYRIVSQLRNYYPLPADCGPGVSTPFPKPQPPNP